jgi:hypothetical protein
MGHWKQLLLIIHVWFGAPDATDREPMETSEQNAKSNAKSTK